MKLNKKTMLYATAAVLVSITTVMAENVKPVILNQPTSVKAKVGDSVTFTVNAVNINKEEKNFTTSIMDQVDLEMIWCPPGSFMMGSPETEMGRSDNESQHKVTLTKGFWLGKYEVTQAQYNMITFGNTNPDTENAGNAPKYKISYNDAITFCERLTQLERLSGKLSSNYKYTLPTEAQWEYACRAGTTTALNNGKNLITSWLESDANLDEVAWNISNSPAGAHLVGEKIPNAWGFYDMHGNVAEWCLDYYVNDLGTDAVTDPVQPMDGSEYSPATVRGGAFNLYAYKECRSAWRFSKTRHETDWYHGFRVALVPVK